MYTYLNANILAKVWFYSAILQFEKLQYHDQIEFFVYEFAVPVKLAHLTY